MKKLFLSTATLAALLILFTSNPACAADTGPYLVGTWEFYVHTSPITESVKTYWNIVNPTSSTIDYCCGIYDTVGNFDKAVKEPLAPNESRALFYGPLGSESGAFKCIAMPRGKWAFDPNIVIGGFQRKITLLGASDKADPGLIAYIKTEATLPAVVINSKTLPEFNRVMEDCRNFHP